MSEELTGAWFYSDDSGWIYDPYADYLPAPGNGCSNHWPRPDTPGYQTRTTTTEGN